MPELTWRPSRPDDAPAITETVNLGMRLAGVHEPVSEDTIREEILGPHWDFERDTVVVELDGRVVAFGGVMAPPPGGSSARAQGGSSARAQGMVHPDFRGRGIGTDLLAWLLARTRSLHAESGASTSWTLRHGGYDGDPSGGELLASAGFAPSRYWFVMTRGVEPVPVIREVDGLRVAAFTPSYSKRLYDAHHAAFADHWDHQDRGVEVFSAHVVDSKAFRPALSMLAIDEHDDVASYVVTFVEADPTLAMLALIGTRRNWRGRGVATQLIGRALGACRDAGVSTATLAVDSTSPTGAVEIYERLGFAVTSRATTYTIEIGASG